MKKRLLNIVLFFCITQISYCQEDDGVVSLALPIRNSLTFNRFVINPTFSFVREQSKFISIYNKREWVDFENAPLTYLASYSGRFGENIGAGLGLFQQNIGVLTTFGGILNFAYNARLGRENNLTFGLNIGTFKSGINTANVVTNFSDPSLQNVSENFLLTVNPGINFGTEFFDFGVSANNLVLYNFESSELINDNPQQSIQAHLMYSGYMDSRGFFDESKFTGLIRSEFQKETTIVSATAMLTVPKGIWGQVSYNTLYGVSAGLGLNITKQIAIEYNYEKAMGDLITFGSSHDITLAYRFINKENYYYGSDDDVVGLISSGTKIKRKSKSVSKEKAEENRKILADRKAQAKLDREDREARLAQQKAKTKANSSTKLATEQKAQKEAEAKTKLAAEQKVQQEAQAKLIAEQKAKQVAEKQAQLIAEQKVQQAAEAQAKLIAEQKTQQVAEAQAQLIAEQKAQQAAEAQAELIAKQKAQQVAEAQAKLIAEQKAQQAAEAQAELIAKQKAQQVAEAQAKLIAEQKAQQVAEAQAQLIAEQKAQQASETQSELIENPKDDIGKSMRDVAQEANKSAKIQDELLEKFNEAISIKNQNLKDLKEENDLSDQGIVVAPKPFKSLTEENNALNSVKSQLDEIIEQRSNKIEELKTLNDERTNIGTTELDEVSLFYKKEIKRLTSEQLKAINSKSILETELASIRVAIEFERRRRIKRAAFDSEEDRYKQDRNTLKNIIENTALNEVPLISQDFDFGEDLGNNIKILKNIKNVDNGYYIILAVHNDVSKRNDFLTKVAVSGRKDIDFFYDVTTSKYYIYYDKFETIEAANRAMQSKGNRPYNVKMSLVKIEN
ncbi:PorP/SprF family type IX secretion system membrane protein [uncultured Winogradskyella sp.]|uniref:PorP/SprF family type IX secretion system membrane protein n=1 Tax=uncultured Winogradskyella sp. TaxID=395353 RepID=UPI0030D76CCE